MTYTQTYFWNGDDIHKSKIDAGRHFKIQDGGWWLQDMLEKPYNMGIFGMGMTCTSQKSMSDAILKSKMADGGLQEMLENLYNMGIFGMGMTYTSQKSMSDAILKSKMADGGLQ